MVERTGVMIRTVIGEPDGAPNFSMRVISFETEGPLPVTVTLGNTKYSS